MSKHVVCYVQRKVITDWKRKVLTRGDSAFIYGSNDDRVFNKMKPGDVLWIASPIPKRPPEIVARLNVEIVADRKDPALNVSESLLGKFSRYKWIARGAKDSRFFGYNNAGKAFMQSVFLTSSGKPWQLNQNSNEWENAYGRRFQRPVEILSPGEEHFKDIAGRPAIFISWKWKDNRKRLIRDLAYHLSDHGFTVWFDQLAMPA